MTVLLIADVALGAAFATQYFAWHWNFDPNLGSGVFTATSVQVTWLRVAGYTLVIGSCVIAWRWPPWWRLTPPCFLAAFACCVAAAGPIYRPYELLVWWWRARHVSLMAPSLMHAGYAFVGMTVTALGATFGVMPRPGRRPPSGSYGTALWGDSRSLVQERGLLIGRSERGKPLRYAGDGHLLTVAPTRSGKGVSVVIPNLLTYPGPVIVTDPKGENYAVTGAQRRVLGAPVHAFDPFDIVGGRAAFNPLDLIDAESPLANDDAWLLADMLVVKTGGAEHAFWDEEARAMLAGLILYVVAHETGSQRTLGRVRALISSTPEQFDGFIQHMAASDAVGGLVARAANRMLSHEPKLRSHVLTAAQNHVHFLDSAPIARVTGASTVSLMTLVEDRASIYLILPPERMETHCGWLRVMIACALQCAKKRDRRSTHRPLFLLDEFANLGPMKPVETGISIAAGYGVAFWLLVQDLAQLRHTYGQSAQTFIANADVLQVFGVNDLETAEHSVEACR